MCSALDGLYTSRTTYFNTSSGFARDCLVEIVFNSGFPELTRCLSSSYLLEAPLEAVPERLVTALTNAY